jgi:hypothetical protein
VGTKEQRHPINVFSTCLSKINTGGIINGGRTRDNRLHPLQAHQNVIMSSIFHQRQHPHHFTYYKESGKVDIHHNIYILLDVERIVPGLLRERVLVPKIIVPRYPRPPTARTSFFPASTARKARSHIQAPEPSRSSPPSSRARGRFRKSLESSINASLAVASSTPRARVLARGSSRVGISRARARRCNVKRLDALDIVRRRARVRPRLDSTRLDSTRLDARAVDMARSSRAFDGARDALRRA